ncbi:MAG: magnesium chelatase [Actinobacteria bacterium]|nr:magnesium chelatase [Actinomycetota bacterium]
MTTASTVGELRASGYPDRGLKEELRQNLLARLSSGEPAFPGVVGFEESVVPGLERGILAGHDLILLGERGQAKTRLTRALAALLDEAVPVVAGCEINDHPYRPICRRCRELVAAEGEAVAVDWIGRDARYAEKLATPDISVADLIGDVDPIKVAEGRHLGDELTIHYGLIPRTNRGIVAINELPDLPERIQVGLFNIMLQEAAPPPAGTPVRVPAFIREILASLTAELRRSPQINHRSGVSVRYSIGNLETVVASALRRAARAGEAEAVPRVVDLPAAVESSLGRIEFDTIEEGREEEILMRALRQALISVFGRHLGGYDLSPLLSRFREGFAVETSDVSAAGELLEQIGPVPGLAKLLQKLGIKEESPGAAASAIEFALEGLHLTRRLNKDQGGRVGSVRYVAPE